MEGGHVSAIARRARRLMKSSQQHEQGSQTQQGRQRPGGSTPAHLGASVHPQKCGKPDSSSSTAARPGQPRLPPEQASPPGGGGTGSGEGQGRPDDPIDC